MSAILTAAEMRAAEERVIAAGISVETLMERAGAAVAEVAWRFAGPMPTLVLCGPGNNGGDGYVVARLLRQRGIPVRVAAAGEPKSEAARANHVRWGGPVEPLAQAEGAALLIDALFGTGLARPLEMGVADSLMRLTALATVSLAVDLPSGAATDDGRILSPVPCYDATVALGSLKPSHLLQPAARVMGRLVTADLGIPAESRLHRLARPRLAAPGADDHKYSRGYVAVAAGEMPGAAVLTATAALRAGAGYVRLVAPYILADIPHAVVQGRGVDALDDKRIGAVAIGPGLGRGSGALALLRRALDSNHPLVLDADALVLLAESGTAMLRELTHSPILTPHAGEFARLFGEREGGKVEAARSAAAEAGAVIVHKGPDTVIAAPDGRAAIASPAPHWLASAGTGDVLTGIISAMRARGLDAFEAACAGVWLHGEAARLAGPGLIADDLVAQLPVALALCL